MPGGSDEIGTAGAQFGWSPLISIIIPVYNIESYLAECLDSITQQQFRDIEIIAVDGGSTDSSTRMLDERGEDEPRLMVMHEPRIGPGAARNMGAEQAKGAYVWFVDGDDFLSAGCLAIIADHLKSTRPDVLVINYETVSPGGKLLPSPVSEQMRTAAKQVFTLAEQPWVIELSMASWNKIVRRDFLHATGLTFSTVWPHEDVSLSGMLLLEARKLSAISEVCYHYRAHRSGSAMEYGEPDRHFHLFDAWRLLLDELRKRAGSEDLAITPLVYHAFFERAIAHCLTVLDTPGFVGPGDRRKFFDHICAYFVNYVPDEYHLPRGRSGLKFRLVAAHAYVLYDLLAWLRTSAARARSSSM